MPKKISRQLVVRSDIHFHRLFTILETGRIPPPMSNLSEWSDEDILFKHPKTGMTPLHMAAQTVDADFINALIVRGADLNASDINGFTPLHFAARAGRADCVEKLSSPQSALIQTQQGVTPLMFACALGNADCARILLPLSDAHARDRDGMTALMWAADKGNVEAIALLAPSSDLFARDELFRMTALEFTKDAYPEAAAILSALMESAELQKEINARQPLASIAKIRL